MKKVYTKPAIVFDSFELAQNIAAGCEGIALFDLDSCSVNIKLPTGGTLNVFVNDNICRYSAPDPDNNNYICYHAPTDANNVFSS